MALLMILKVDLLSYGIFTHISERFTFDCERSKFHVKIMFIPCRRLRLITDTNLSSLLSKGPNYRVPNTLTYSNYKIPIDSSIDNCIEKLKTKFRLRDIDLND